MLDPSTYRDENGNSKQWAADEVFRCSKDGGSKILRSSLAILEAAWSPHYSEVENMRTALSLMSNSPTARPSEKELLVTEWHVWEDLTAIWANSKGLPHTKQHHNPNRIGDPLVKHGKISMATLQDEAAWLLNRSYGAGSPHRAAQLAGLFDKSGERKAHKSKSQVASRYGVIHQPKAPSMIACTTMLMLPINSMDMLLT